MQTELNLCMQDFFLFSWKLIARGEEERAKKFPVAIFFCELLQKKKVSKDFQANERFNKLKCFNYFFSP